MTIPKVFSGNILQYSGLGQRFVVFCIFRIHDCFFLRMYYIKAYLIKSFPTNNNKSVTLNSRQFNISGRSPNSVSIPVPCGCKIEFVRMTEIEKKIMRRKEIKERFSGREREWELMLHFKPLKNIVGGKRNKPEDISMGEKFEKRSL